MKPFDWEIFKKFHSEAAYDYLFHIYQKNIQETDFIRGYSSLEPVQGKQPTSRRYSRRLYNKLKDRYGFFRRPA